MKVCQTCGEEIYTKDGENKCLSCESQARGPIKRAEAKAKRLERESVLKSLGLNKVRGALGGTYWE